MTEFFRAAATCDRDIVKASPLPVDMEEVRRHQFIHEKLVSQAVQTQLMLQGVEKFPGIVQSSGKVAPKYRIPGAIDVGIDPELRNKGPVAERKELEARINDSEFKAKQTMEAVLEKERIEKGLQEKRREVEASKESRRAEQAVTEQALFDDVLSTTKSKRQQRQQQARAKQKSGGGGGGNKNSRNVSAASSRNRQVGDINNNDADAEEEDEDFGNTTASGLLSKLTPARLREALHEKKEEVIVSPLAAGWSSKRLHPVDVLHQRIAAEIRRELYEFEHRQATTFLATRLRGRWGNNNSNNSQQQQQQNDDSSSSAIG